MTVAAPENIPASVEETAEAADEDVLLSLDEIEAAYLRALETAEAAEALLPEDFVPEPEPESSPLEPSPTSTTIVDERTPPPDRIAAVAESHPPAASVAGPELLTASSSAEPRPISALEVVEAFLFVGGTPLPVKKITEVLGSGANAQQVEEFLATLNARYNSEGRPYEIRLVEGGYKLQLREEFEPVRRKVYGQGPKEVKLGQEALEILAFIAYQQPVTREEIEATGRQNVPTILRQLLRRELVVLKRDAETGECYRTTQRFLELFGLNSLYDLPQAGDFSFR
ncbi:SMC-Scp complex subunit ScpB [Planctomicrobium sp. SH664]|uniref:SMC-Scp complex subunit ScpB n=1 Tax=Planctomicrobium sp. SH664 TaxID=3448125 RepID=UPI003F5C2B20